MSVDNSKFAKLMDLAKETSSEKRRDLLREVTDIFFDNNPRSSTECAMFDEIIGAVASDMTEQVRFELSRKVAKSKAPLRRTAVRLANDTINIARPVLQHSTALTSEDLVKLVQTQKQDHLLSISKRRDVCENVSKALVEKGEDPVLVSLLENQNARIDRTTYEDIADRAANSPVLHAPFVQRQSVPLDLLNDMYLIVEEKLRKHVMERYNSVSEEELNAALAASKSRLSEAYLEQPKDLEDARAWLSANLFKKTVKPPTLVQLLRDNRGTHFLVTFAHFTDTPMTVISRLVTAKDIDAIAILCRSAGFEKALFTSIAIHLIGGENGVAKAKKFSDMYDDVPPAAAQRAVRFWKVREKAQTSSAA